MCESKIDLKTETNALLCQHVLTRNPCTERTAVIKKSLKSLTKVRNSIDFRFQAALEFNKRRSFISHRKNSHISTNFSFFSHAVGFITKWCTSVEFWLLTKHIKQKWELLILFYEWEGSRQVLTTTMSTNSELMFPCLASLPGFEPGLLG